VCVCVYRCWCVCVCVCVCVCFLRLKNSRELNTLGPIRVTQALLPQIKENGGKVIIISTQMGSIADNTSGGMQAYRASKAAVNMVGKGLSVELKDKGIAVGLVHPGFVATAFCGKVLTV